MQDNLSAQAKRKADKAAYDKARYHLVRDSKIAQIAAWRIKNPERNAVNHKKWNESDKRIEYDRKRYLERKEEKKAQSKRWKKANAERAKQLCRAHYLKDLAGSKAQRREWRQNNPDARAAGNQRRRARKMASGGSHTANDIKEIWNRQEHKCAVPTCTNPIAASGKYRYHVDHIQALINGGSNGKENIQCLCAPCNMRKHTCDEYVWAQRELGTLFVM